MLRSVGIASGLRSPSVSMITPAPDTTYLIELCSGEQRRWRFEGVDGRGFGWWLDEETGFGFSDASLMYALTQAGGVLLSPTFSA